MNKTKHTIWSNLNLDINDWGELRDEHPGYTENDLIKEMYRINNDYLDDERCNLNIKCRTDIIVFGDIGRWNGRVSGYRLIKSGNIADCLYTDCDMVEWYVDENGEFCSTQIHHDGTNYLYYRKFKNNLSSDEKEDFLDRFYEGKTTQEDIDHVTDKLGKMIAKVYGWN